MVFAGKLAAVIGLGVVLTACGADEAWKPRRAVPQPPTQVIGGLPVATLCKDLPELTEAEVASLVARVGREMDGARVRRIIHSRSHPLERRYVELQLDYHETHARVRLGRSVLIRWDEEEEGDAERGAWSRHTDRHSFLNAEVCAPERSFLGETPVPEADIVHVIVSRDLTVEEIVEVVDAVYDDVPAGQKPRSIRREGDDAFEVMTVRATKYRSLSGYVLEVRPGSWGWKVTRTGEWVS